MTCWLGLNTIRYHISCSYICPSRMRRRVGGREGKVKPMDCDKSSLIMEIKYNNRNEKGHDRKGEVKAKKDN